MSRVAQVAQSSFGGFLPIYEVFLWCQRVKVRPATGGEKAVLSPQSSILSPRSSVLTPQYTKRFSRECRENLYLRTLRTIMRIRSGLDDFPRLVPS